MILEVKKIKVLYKGCKLMNKLRRLILRYFRALTNKDTPMLAKLLAALSLIYIALPADVIPDIFPFLGYVDDTVLTAALIYFSNKLIPEEIKKETRSIEG